jgi:hypothetical protein
MMLYLHLSIHPHGMLNLCTETSSFFKISATLCCGVYKERSHTVGKNRYFCLYMMIFPYSDKEHGSSEIMNAVVILAIKPQYEESLIKLKLLKIHHKININIKKYRKY